MLLRNLLFAAVLTLPASSVAAEQVLLVDAKASAVSFELPATGHTVRGTFAVSSGQLRFDRETGRLSGQITVDATSGRTGNARRDRAMHADVLESAKYPRIVFRPSSLDGRLTPSGESTATVRGTMSIHGSDHPVSIPVKVQIAGSRVTALGTFEVPYVAWGLKDPSVFVVRVAKKVRMDVALQGTLSGE